MHMASSAGRITHSPSESGLRPNASEARITRNIGVSAPAAPNRIICMRRSESISVRTKRLEVSKPKNALIATMFSNCTSPDTRNPKSITEAHRAGSAQAVR